MEDISKVLDELFDGEYQQKEQRVSDDELKKAYAQSEEIKGPPRGMECIGVIFEPYHDVTIYRDKSGRFWSSRYYIGD